MLLSDIRSYCAAAGEVSLQQLSNRFDTEPEALRGMMEVLADKGMIRCLSDRSAPACGSACGGCSSGCASQALLSDIRYEWVGRRRNAPGRH